MNSIYSLTGKFLLLYRVSPSTWLLITAAFLLLWTFLMCLLDWHIPAEQRMNPMFQRSAHRRRRAAFVLNLLLMLVGLAIVALVTFVRRGSVEQRFVLYPFRVLYGMKAPGDYWQVTIMNLVLYVPFACGLTFCFGRSRGGFGRRSVLATVLICFLLSLLAETLQYVTGSGLAEVDDVLVNTLGGALGTIPYLFFRKHNNAL